VTRTTTLTYGDRGFWALDDACAVWLAYLVEEAIGNPTQDDPWCIEAREQWRVAAAITQLGAHVPQSRPEQLGRLRATALAARDRAQARGDLPEQDLRSWIVVDDLPVSNGFSRRGAVIEVQRILEVADAFIALIDGTLPADPPAGAWFVGLGRGYEVMPYRDAPLTPGESRFPHRAG
jgi:hypothetical protein